MKTLAEIHENARYYRTVTCPPGPILDLIRDLTEAVTVFQRQLDIAHRRIDALEAVLVTTSALNKETK